MELLQFRVHFLLGLIFSGFGAGQALTFPRMSHSQHALFSRLQHTQRSVTEEPPKARQQVNTVRVECHPDFLEIVIQADMFAVGAPVSSDDIHLGVDDDYNCRARVSSEDEYKIVVGLMDCGTKHWVTEDSLIYTNLLLYSPTPSPNGVIRMDEAVIPIECQYERKYSLSSSSLMPSWVSFKSTMSAVENLDFSLRLMTGDWQYERGSKVYFLGDRLNIEASVRVGHHMKLRVFLNRCVATLSPDTNTEPRYVFVEDGCLVDSVLTGSKSHFLARTEENTLQMVIDAFKFHNDKRGEIYITCSMNAVPLDDTDAPNKACTLVNGRWRSVDGNDYLCGYCQTQNEIEAVGKVGSTSWLGSRGFGRPVEFESSWRSGLKTNKLFEQEARLGPVLVLPRTKNIPLPFEELPAVIANLGKPSLYGSQWRSGKDPIALEEEDLDGSSATQPAAETAAGENEVAEDIDAEIEVDEGHDEDFMDLEEAGPEFQVESLPALGNSTTTEAPTERTTTPEAADEEEITSTHVTVVQADSRE